MPDEKKIAEGLALLREGTKDMPTDCPHCGSTDVSTDDHDGGCGDVLKETCSCNECGSVWENHYEIFQQKIIEDGTTFFDGERGENHG
jgi:hypothetical protein